MGAPVGNKFAVGNNGGRPPIYDNAEMLQNKCDAYFEYIKGETNKESGEITRNPEFATITGLALYLGFCGRKMLLDYEKKEEFSYIIKMAKAKVEAHYEQSLNNQSCTGAIFALKNMGWIDKVETGFTNTEGEDLLDVSKFPTDLLESILNAKHSENKPE